MTANPLSSRLSEGRTGKVTEAMLHDYVADINRRTFVRVSGQPYFVNYRRNMDGTNTAFLDRKI